MALALLLALGVSSWVAMAHPGLRLVDFLAFGQRARALFGVESLLHPLYPVGYPALLKLGQLLLGDLLLAGKVLAVLAGVAAVAASTRWLGLAAGLWLMVQAGTLTHASTEGTDLAAVALMLAGLAASAERRPGLAGLLLGAACLCRYTAVVALPAGLFLATGARWRLLGLFLVSTAPHWATALILGRSPLPDQTANLVIASGALDARLFSTETLQRWPAGIARAWHVATVGWPTMLGALGLIIGVLRRKRAAVALTLLAGGHLALVGLAFANGRLVLPATLSLALGARWLLPRPLLLLMVLGLGVTTVPLAREASTTESQIHEAVAACGALPGPMLASSPWMYRHDEGWLVPATPIQGLGSDARALDPSGLRLRAQEHGYRSVVVDAGRVRRTYPALEDLLKERPPPGLELACEAGSFKGYRVLSD